MAMHGELYIAGKIGPEQVDLIRSRFAALIGKDIDFMVKRDETLIGGFLATINGTVYDASIATQIKHAKEWLLAKDNTGASI